MAGLPDAALARLGFVPFYLRSNVFTMPEFWNAASTAIAPLTLHDFRDRLHLYENLRASLCRGDCSGACVGWSPLTAAVILVVATGIYTIAGDWPR